MNFVIESYSYTFSHTFRSTTYILISNSICCNARLSAIYDLVRFMILSGWFSERHYNPSFSECRVDKFLYSSKLKKQQRNIESNHWEVAKSFPSLVTLNSAKSQVRLSSVLHKAAVLTTRWVNETSKGTSINNVSITYRIMQLRSMI